MSVRAETKKIRGLRDGRTAKELDLFGYSGGIVTWTRESASESVILMSSYRSKELGSGDEILYRDVVSVSADGRVKRSRRIYGYVLEEYLGYHHCDSEGAKSRKSLVGANFEVVPKAEESELAEKMKSVGFYDFTKMENVELCMDLKEKLVESNGDVIQYLFDESQ